MALPWIKVHSNLRRHPKAMALSDAVEQDHAWCYLVALWAWASEFCPTGVISVRGIPRLVEREAGWTGQQGALFDAMVQTGWLIVCDDGVVIHGWEEYQLPHIEHAKREAARQKAIREKAKEKRALTDSYGTVLRIEDGTQDSTEDRTRTETRTVARPDRDRDKEIDISTKNLALFASAPGAAVEVKPKRGRPPKAKAEGDEPSCTEDRERWLAQVRVLTGLTESELIPSKNSNIRFAQQRKLRGMDQLMRALEGLQNDPFAKTAGLGYLLSDDGITKGLAKWKKEAGTTHISRQYGEIDPELGF
jgi:hypothetical protein